MLREGQPVSYFDSLTVVMCCSCGVPFGIAAEMNKELINNHRSFYCPNGHRQNYIGKTQEEKLKEELLVQKNLVNHHRNEADRKQRRLNALRGQQTKLKNRIKNGVCPCCNRSFVNLAKHMAHIHPDFSKE